MATASKKQAQKKSPKRAAGKSQQPKAPKSTSAKSPPKSPPKKKGRAAEPERSAPQQTEVDAEVLEFIAAIDRFKQQNGRPFPSWSEVLLIVRQLGYRRG
jgi:hypothetical protein